MGAGWLGGAANGATEVSTVSCLTLNCDEATLREHRMDVTAVGTDLHS